ncbi:hypothetical protein EDD65_101105 [Keratinibaculum paraultunense]|uniref:Uncharacterized protein n=1 Tax=Keratinibaculum paraultunense TaxID=1278232 RepID=A0A4R3L1M2_9FIRM|nr:hypothetical protein [Keratinibaculum paraultunense]QQY80077.1 hypothetical protein JL105_01700 [Keratinibaculum paraultunense]TCS91603.1 hypothetical protein EDD65_101105 [Keratinibaculum paraultunense]
MHNLSYEQIRILQENTIKKLIKYINEFINEDKSLESIEFYYPDFDEQKTMIAFNVWVSTDYRTHYGKSFIEHMLEDKAYQLTNIEKQILIERNKSHISLFEILEADEEHIYLIDLFTRKDHQLWEPNLAPLLNENILIFGRIGRILEHEGFIGNISFLPNSIKDMFIQEILLDYNYIRIKEPQLTIDKYLKKYSLNVYRIYTECIYSVIQLDEDFMFLLYDELEEFENYLSHQMSKTYIKKHINNLINLFEHYLMDEEMTLSDLDQINLKLLLEDAIDNGFINNKKEFNSFLSTLKKYLTYLKNKSNIYKKAYEQVLEISKNRFLYLNKIENTELPFCVDKVLVNNIDNSLNEQAFSFLIDFEKFLLYIISNELESTNKNKYIKRKDLFKINEIMENKETIIKKTPNQKDFPLLHIFYKFSIDTDLITIKNNKIISTKKAPLFLKMGDEEKYSIFLQYILNHNFLKKVIPTIDLNFLENLIDDMIKLFSKANQEVYYRYQELTPKYIQYPECFLVYYKYLELIGLLKYRYYPYIAIAITPFGNKVFNVLSNRNKLGEHYGKIIQINEYLKGR